MEPTRRQHGKIRKFAASSRRFKTLQKVERAGQQAGATYGHEVHGLPQTFYPGASEAPWGGGWRPSPREVPHHPSRPTCPRSRSRLPAAKEMPGNVAKGLAHRASSSRPCPPRMEGHGNKATEYRTQTPSPTRSWPADGGYPLSSPGQLGTSASHRMVSPSRGRRHCSWMVLS